MPTYVCACRLFLRTSRRLGSAPVRLACTEVPPGVVLCLCAQGEGTFLHIARYEALLAPRIGAQPFLANRSFTTWGSGDHGHRQYKAWPALVQ
jgi:hypothetical protein